MAPYHEAVRAAQFGEAGFAMRAEEVVDACEGRRPTQAPRLRGVEGPHPFPCGGVLQRRHRALHITLSRRPVCDVGAAWDQIW